MQKITLKHEWVQLTTPCTFQVISGSRVHVSVDQTPEEAYFVVSVMDIWDNTSSDPLFVRSIEAADTSTITVIQL